MKQWLGCPHIDHRGVDERFAWECVSASQVVLRERVFTRPQDPDSELRLRLDRPLCAWIQAYLYVSIAAVGVIFFMKEYSS
jgi:hypothetical protein